MPLAYDSTMSLHLTAAISSTPLSQDMSKHESIQMQLSQVEWMDTKTPRNPEVTLKYDKSTKNLKKVIKIKIKIGVMSPSYK